MASARPVAWSDLPSQTGILLKVVEKIIQRLSKIKFDDPTNPLVNGLKQKQILTATHDWNYLSWDGSATCLRPNRSPSNRLAYKR